MSNLKLRLATMMVGLFASTGVLAAEVNPKLLAEGARLEKAPPLILPPKEALTLPEANVRLHCLMGTIVVMLPNGGYGFQVFSSVTGKPFPCKEK
jgi:hypothetical protein